MSSFEPLPNGPSDGRFVPHEDGPKPGAFVRDGASAAPEPVESPQAAPPAEEPTPADPAVALQAAYDEGLRAGRESLPWREATQLEGALEALEGAARALLELERHYLGAHRRLAVELSLTIAESLLQQAVQADPERLAEQVARASEALAPAEPLRVRLSDADLKALEAGGSPVLARLREMPGLRLEADAELERGDFRVVGERSRVDARRAELLRRVRAELLAELDGGEVAS